MSGVAIARGGFAGVGAAEDAVHQRTEDSDATAEIRVTMASTGDGLVMRPPLYETEPDRMRGSLGRNLSPIGLRRSVATVTAEGEVPVARRDRGAQGLSYHPLVFVTRRSPRAGSVLSRGVVCMPTPGRVSATPTWPPACWGSSRPDAPRPLLELLGVGPGGCGRALGWDRVVQKPGGRAKGLQAVGQFSLYQPSVDEPETLTAAHYEVPRPDLA